MSDGFNYKDNIIWGLRYYIKHGGNDPKFFDDVCKSGLNTNFRKKARFYFVNPRKGIQTFFSIPDIEFIEEPKQKNPFLFFNVQLKDGSSNFFLFQDEKSLQIIYSQLLDLQIKARSVKPIEGEGTFLEN